MISSQTSTSPISGGASSRVGGLKSNRFAREDFDPCRPQPGGSSEATALNRAEVSLTGSAKEAPRILLVDATLALREFHLELLRSIPSIVESLAFCAETYVHEGHGYALVVLMLHTHSRERLRRWQSLSAIGGNRREPSCSKASPQWSTIGFTTSGLTLVCIRQLCARRRFDS
jgi:hypothetical protein